MELKVFKQDLIYCCKKYIKDGINLTTDTDNISIDIDNKFILDGNLINPFEAFVLIKGLIPTKHMINYPGYNLSTIEVISEQCNISLENLYSLSNGIENYDQVEKNDFYNLGIFLREKFSPLGSKVDLVPIKFYLEKPLETEKIGIVFYIVYINKIACIVEAEISKVIPVPRSFKSMPDEDVFIIDECNKDINKKLLGGTFYNLKSEAERAITKWYLESLLNKFRRSKFLNPENPDQFLISEPTYNICLL